MAQYPSAAAGDSNLYIAVNKTSTTLTDNPLAAGAVTVNVLDASAFPSVGAISIDAEIIHYTGKTGTSFTGCTRGFDGTTDVAHTVSTPVYHKVIADHHNVLKEEIKAIESDLIACKAALNDVDTPASTSSDVKDRLDQIVSQLKLITGGVSWYTAPAKNLTQLLPLSGGTITGNIAMSGTQKLTGLVAGSTAGDSVRYEQVVGVYAPIADITPAGAITAFGGTSAPSGWLLCDGSAVSRTTYATLYAAIGVAFGYGNNSTTFNLPDFRGRFLRGRDGGTARDPNAATRTAMATGGNTGDNVGSIQANATKLPNTAFGTSDPGNHSHTYQLSGIGTAANNIPARDADGNNTIYTNSTSSDGGAHTHTLNGGDSETRPLNANVNYIIKY